MQWVLFTFPSRYWSTIGLWRVFSLGGWSRRIHTGFHVPRATQDAARLHDASCTGLSPATVGLSRTFHSRQSCHIAVLQPRGSRNSRGLGCAPFARHYLGYHVLFSLPPGTKMFQFPGLLVPTKWRYYNPFLPITLFSNHLPNHFHAKFHSPHPASQVSSPTRIRVRES